MTRLQSSVVRSIDPELVSGRKPLIILPQIKKQRHIIAFKVFKASFSALKAGSALVRSS